MEHKQTIKKTVSISGKGLHTGVFATLTLTPAGETDGIKFIRTDLGKKTIIPADVNYVTDTQRSTTITKGEASVSTIEHLLSALSALHIDNLIIEIDGPEVPILDGSAMPFVALIEEAGIEKQDIEREYFICQEPISYSDDNGTNIIMLPCDDLDITTLIDFNSPVLGKQFAEYKAGDDYKEQLAPSKTFVFTHELIPLIDNNLIKGGDLNNAIVVANTKMSDADVKKISDKIDFNGATFNTEGIVNSDSLRFENEPARHKLLDLLGDLSLVGRQIKGKIIANKPGHTSNVAFAKLIKQELQKQRKLKGKPNYDPAKEPIFDIEGIKKFLPHRYPFLLVDKIIELGEDLVVGIKSITGNEAFFQGHFPGNPVFPGVLQMEALAQTGGILALSGVEDPELWDTYFLKMDNVKFKNKVVPGDSIILKMELLTPIRRGIVHMQGTAYVGDRIVSEGELTAQIIKRQ